MPAQKRTASAQTSGNGRSKGSGRKSKAKVIRLDSDEEEEDDDDGDFKDVAVSAGDDDDDDEAEEEDGDERVTAPPSKKIRGSETGAAGVKVENAPKEDTKPATDASTSAGRGGAGKVVIEKNDDGESYIKLSEYRRVTIKEYRGKTLVDIREVYKDKSSGAMRPGTKGISLTIEQWTALKDNLDQVDEMIAGQKEK